MNKLSILNRLIRTYTEMYSSSGNIDHLNAAKLAQKKFDALYLDLTEVTTSNELRGEFYEKSEFNIEETITFKCKRG